MKYIFKNILKIVLIMNGIIDLNYSQVSINNIPITPFVANESSVFIHPNNPNIILLSNNLGSGLFPGPLSTWYSLDGGYSWNQTSAPYFYILPNFTAIIYGDPSVFITKNGDFYLGGLGNSPGYRINIAVSNNNGTNWNLKNISSVSNGDKPNLWIDDKIFNLSNINNVFHNKLYMTWYDEITDIQIASSNNGGSTWSTPQNISAPVNATCRNHAPCIRTGTNGEVYVCWAIIDNCIGDNLVSSIGFAKSMDGGNTWLSQRIRPINGMNGLGGGKILRVNSFPSMAINNQNGNIYITWGEKTNNGDGDIYFIKSSDNGTSWSAPIKVNQDNTGSDQWWPWITCDPNNNAIIVIYFDSRNFPLNDKASTYISISYDEGISWQDFKVNSVDWTPFGPFIGYDYIAIDSKYGLVIPIWSQGDNGNVLVYTNPFNIPCPQDLSLIYGNYFITDEVSFDDDASYSAINNIYVAGQTIHNSTYKIYPNASVYMSAGNDIIIDDGFESEGEFIAEISPCNYFGGKLINNPRRILSLHTQGKEILISTHNGNDIKNKEGELVSIFPNPTSSSITLQTTHSSHTIQHISIKDLSGKTLFQQTISLQSSVSIDLSDFSNGLYFIEVQTNQGVFTEKVVVQR